MMASLYHNVGAVIIVPDGTIETAYRGEFRQGDHAEYTLLDKKLRTKDVTGSTMFVTLEPCAPGARKPPKMSCAERIVNARIKEIYIGIIDPDPTVANQGFNYMEENGINVYMFDRDLQNTIELCNEKFLDAAHKRAEQGINTAISNKISALEKFDKSVNMNYLSQDAIDYFCERSQISKNRINTFLYNSGLAEKTNNTYVPNGTGILLFGKNPREFFPQAGIKAKCTFANGKENFYEINGPLVLSLMECEKWYHSVIVNEIDRNQIIRKEVLGFPFKPIREAVLNAVIHRDYSIEGAKVIISIDKEKIIVQSPGKPIGPNSIQDLEGFTASARARNPKIAYIFSCMKEIEEVGYGMSTFKQMPSEFNRPQPKIVFEHDNVYIIFARSYSDIKSLGNSALKELNEEELKGYEYIKQMSKLSKKQYSDHFLIDDKKAQRHIKKMLDLGLVIRTEGISPKSNKLTYEINKKS